MTFLPVEGFPLSGIPGAYAADTIVANVAQPRKPTKKAAASLQSAPAREDVA